MLEHDKEREYKSGLKKYNSYIPEDQIPVDVFGNERLNLRGAVKVTLRNQGSFKLN
mgnify:CR=1 FL=1